MTHPKLFKTFGITENPWWNSKYYDAKGVNDLLKNVSHLRSLIKEQVSLDDEYWKGYIDYHHIKYLLECITIECSNINLTYDELEELVNAGVFLKFWYFLFNRKKFRMMKKIQNLHHAAKLMFPDIFLFKSSPVEKLNIRFVQELHHQVGKGIISNAGKFRTKHAKPAQEDFFYLPPDLIERRLSNLLKECRQVFADPSLLLEDAVKFGACFLEQFLYIHPFSNGNGRVGRLLLSYLLTKYTIVPLSLYSSDTCRDTYLQCLREARRELYADYRNPASLSRFILESIEREFLVLRYSLDLEEFPGTKTVT